MDEVLTKFLTQKNANAEALSRTLHEHQEEVIASFGGMTNVIQLCLTHPNAAQNIDVNQMDSFIQLVEIQQDADKLKTIHEIENNFNMRKIENETDKSTVSTVGQFYRSKLTIECYQTNNLLFALFNNTNVNINCNVDACANTCTCNLSKSFSSLYNLILSKQLGVIICFLFCLVIICYELIPYASHPSNVTWDLLMCCIIFSSILLIFYSISLILIANITIVELITNTFDFWFKAYNGILWLVSYWVIRFNVEKQSWQQLWYTNNGMATMMMNHINNK